MVKLDEKDTRQLLEDLVEQVSDMVDVLADRLGRIEDQLELNGIQNLIIALHRRQRYEKKARRGEEGKKRGSVKHGQRY